MTNEGRVYFMLWGDDFDPDEVTRYIGFEPTTIMRKGNPKPKRSSWQFSTDKIEDELIDVYEMSAALVSKLKPHTDKISSIKKQLGLDAVLEVVLRITADDNKLTPAIGFGTDVISFLNNVGASIDIDTYRNVTS